MPNTNKIGELKFAEVIDDMQMSLQSLQEQIQEDGIILMELKWRVVEMRVRDVVEGRKERIYSGGGAGVCPAQQQQLWPSQC